jgi:phage terminase small subunit
MALNDRQQAFLDELKKQPRGKRNATEAAIRAGYSEKTARAIASRLLRNVYIKKEIDELDAERNRDAERASEITCDWVVEKIKGIVDDPKASNKDRLKGLELLGKYLDIFAGKREQEQQTVRVVFEDPEMEAWGE